MDLVSTSGALLQRLYFGSIYVSVGLSNKESSYLAVFLSSYLPGQQKLFREAAIRSHPSALALARGPLKLFCGLLKLKVRV